MLIRDHSKDTGFTRIEPSTTFCTKHRIELFTLSDGTVVNGDLHPVESSSIQRFASVSRR